MVEMARGGWSPCTPPTYLKVGANYTLISIWLIDSSLTNTLLQLGALVSAYGGDGRDGWVSLHTPTYLKVGVNYILSWVPGGAQVLLQPDPYRKLHPLLFIEIIFRYKAARGFKMPYILKFYP
jgi:hypothetical protein